MFFAASFTGFLKRIIVFCYTFHKVDYNKQGREYHDFITNPPSVNEKLLIFFFTFRGREQKEGVKEVYRLKHIHHNLLVETQAVNHNYALLKERVEVCRHANSFMN